MKTRPQHFSKTIWTYVYKNTKFKKVSHKMPDNVHDSACKSYEFNSKEIEHFVVIF